MKFHSPAPRCPAPRCVVAIPARDEAERIGECLEALNGQQGARLDDIVLFVNNSSDDTAAIARATLLHPATRLHVIEENLPAAHATAGFARRAAMNAASLLAGPNGVLLTTDADGLADPDWLFANLASLRAGADAVAGWVELHPAEWSAIPAALHENDARECEYDALCDEIHARLDPDPSDPWPRHTQHSGASIAVTGAAFALCGGVPPVPIGEDRAFIASLRRTDRRIRHAPEVHMTVSGRIVGRAKGGMADTIRRRLTKPDPLLDDRLEPAIDCARRAWLRAELRRSYRDVSRDRADLVDRLGLSPAALAAALASPYFGIAWESVERLSPQLRRARVPVHTLPSEVAMARALLGGLDALGAGHAPYSIWDLIAEKL